MSSFRGPRSKNPGSPSPSYPSSRPRPVNLSAVELDDLADLAGRDVPTLVAEATLGVLATARGPHVASVEQLDLALAPLLLAVRDDPHIGSDPRVVEHLLRQGDDGL